MSEQIVATVRSLTIYPVKSMRGLAVEELSCYWYGANGDRKAAFTQVGDLSGFPWLTGRELPALLQYTPAFVDPRSPQSSPIRVHTPSGRLLALESDELRHELQEQHGAPLALLKLKRGTFDAMPLSLISTATVRAIAQAAPAQGSAQLDDARRYRPNILLELADGFSEDAWPGATLIFGHSEDGAQVQVNYPIKRCVMINLHPDSAHGNPELLKQVARQRDSLAGVYAAVSKPGLIRLGDVVCLRQGAAGPEPA